MCTNHAGNMQWFINVLKFAVVRLVQGSLARCEACQVATQSVPYCAECDMERGSTKSPYSLVLQ